MKKKRRRTGMMATVVVTVSACSGTGMETTRNPPPLSRIEGPAMALGDRVVHEPYGTCTHHFADGSDARVLSGCPETLLSGPGTLWRAPSGECSYAGSVSCPPPSVATCNPPPPTPVACPEGSPEIGEDEGAPEPTD